MTKHTAKRNRRRVVKIHRLALSAILLIVFVISMKNSVEITDKPQETDTPTIGYIEAEFTLEHKAKAAITESQPTAKTTTMPESETTLPPSPFTDVDVELLAELMTAEAHVVMWNGEQHGVSAYARIAAVGWCVLNRVDQTGATLEDVIKKPHQFAWHDGIEVADDIRWLAADVLERYWAEKQGVTNVGRTLPETYLYFHGDGRENYFREEYKGNGEYWDWSLEDPYSD